MVEGTKTRMTMAEFLTMPETTQIVELIGGEVYVTAPFDKHQARSLAVVAFLLRLNLGGALRFAPTGLYLDDEDYLEPDVFWVSPENPNCKLVDDEYWHGAPDLVVEVLSSSTARRDRREKFQLYQKYGVREYWLVDPDAEYVEVYRREGQQLVMHGIWAPGETFVSPVLSNQTVPVAALFER